MNESQKLKKEIFIIVFLMFVVIDLIFFADVVYYDFSERITNKKEHLIEYTVIGLETGEVHTLLDSMFIKYYSILQDADGNTIKVQQTYKDYVGREVWVYSEGYTGCGIRKDYEIKRMNVFNYLCTIGFLCSIWIFIRMVIGLLKEKRNRE